jgi:hypothetical protein
VEYDIHKPGYIAHGVLLTGGSFHDIAIDPLISRIITQEVGTTSENLLPTQAWFPASLAAVNRFLEIDGTLEEHR